MYNNNNILRHEIMHLFKQQNTNIDSLISSCKKRQIVLLLKTAVFNNCLLENKKTVNYKTLLKVVFMVQDKKH